MIVWMFFIIACGSKNPDLPPKPEPRTSNEGGFAVTRLPVTSFYKDTPEHPAEYWRHTFFLETNGKSIFVNQLKGPLLEINHDGIFAGIVSRQGDGPGEHHGPIFGLSADAGRLTVIDRGRVLFFQNNRYQSQFIYSSSGRLPVNGLFRCRGFDVADGNVVVPWSDGSRPGHVGTVFTTDGELKQTVVDEAFDPSLTALSPLADSVMWRRGDDIWYCAYLFTPRIALFDKNFEKLGDLTFDSPETLRYEINWHQTNREGLTNPRRRIPLFFNFQVLGDEGLLMSQGLLHQINLKTGALVGLYRFYAPDHPDLKEGAFQNFPYCALLDNRTLVLAHAINDYAGELFAVKLPPLDEARL